MIGLLMVLPAGQAADMTKAKAAEYIFGHGKSCPDCLCKGGHCGCQKGRCEVE